VTPIGRSTPTPAEQEVALGAYSDAEASVIATRLYRALLGREPDAAGLAGTISEVRAGRGRQRIEEIVSSAEFASHNNPLSPEAILEQFYRGLLGRSVDAAGVSGRIQNFRDKRYAAEAISIIQSQEFRSQLAAAVSAMPSTPAGGVVSVPTSSAIDCQERVVEAIRNDLTGFVLITFDSAAMSGSATDVSDGGRRLSYRCDPSATASYNYDDGRRARSAPNAGEFANDIVRSCQGEIRTKAKQQLGAANVVFESAGLMPSDNGTHAVRGLGFQRSAAGRNGANFVYSCDMRGTQILVSSVRNR
jgi:hypothetical protein